MSSTPGPARPEQNFGLSPEEFHRMADELRHGNPLLFERIFLAHFEAGTTYLSHHDGATPEEAYDSMMEALLQLRAGIVSGRITYGNLRYLLTRMARQDFARRRRRAGRLRIVVADGLPEGTADEAADDPFPESEFDLLERAFRSLGNDCRSLLREFYYDRLSLRDIAEREGRAAPAVRQQKTRCVKKLRKYFRLFANR